NGYGSGGTEQAFGFDDAFMNLVLPNPDSAKWYKSWRTGLAVASGSSDPIYNGWTGPNFKLVDTFVATSGSTHWWQPYDNTNVSHAPNGGSKSQTQGFSQGIGPNRFDGIQSFRRMTTTDPGRLSMQWSGEKEIAGFKIVPGAVTNSILSETEAWPRKWQVSVLKPRAEWTNPLQADLSETSNDFRIVRQFSLGIIGHPTLPEPYPATGPWSKGPDAFNVTDANTQGTPNGRIQTWLFDEPVTTEGMRVEFIVNCDHFERAVHSNRFNFKSATTAKGLDISGKNPWNEDPLDADVGLGFSGCPNNNQFSPNPNEWISDLGIGISYFTALEIIDRNTLPLSNECENQNYLQNNLMPEPSFPTVYAAVDLGRHHHIDTDDDLFELIADTRDQTTWNTGTFLFSEDDVDDPNEVVWAGAASNARWVRFLSTSTDDFEAFVQTFEFAGSINSSTSIDFLPQSTIRAARIYPALTTALFSTEGYNSSWEDLGSTLTDNRNDTFI
ncbi:hypothetical protein LCGC14_2501800, partial [marine sediment metagenome]